MALFSTITVFLLSLGILTGGNLILFFCFLFGIFLLLSIKWFSRDPERIAPAGDNLVLSAADGHVVSLENVMENLYIGGEGIVVGVYLSLFDIHINRIPMTGCVRFLSRKPGTFLPAFRDRASTRNEQQIIGIESTRGKILMKQIAGCVARRIVCRLHLGESVQAGDRFGIIKLGSRVEIVVPPHTEIKVKVGEKVRAGETVIGVMR